MDTESKEYKELIKKYSKYWRARGKANSEFYKKEQEIENSIPEHNGVKIGFVYDDMDGFILGMGAVDHEEREKFPLLMDSDLSEQDLEEEKEEK